MQYVLWQKICNNMNFIRQQLKSTKSWIFYFYNRKWPSLVWIPVGTGKMAADCCMQLRLFCPPSLFLPWKTLTRDGELWALLLVNKSDRTSWTLWTLLFQSLLVSNFHLIFKLMDKTCNQINRWNWCSPICFMLNCLLFCIEPFNHLRRTRKLGRKGYTQALWDLWPVQNPDPSRLPGSGQQLGGPWGDRELYERLAEAAWAGPRWERADEEGSRRHWTPSWARPLEETHVTLQLPPGSDQRARCEGCAGCLACLPIQAHQGIAFHLYYIL